VDGRTATARAAESSPPQLSRIDARCGRAGHARAWGGSGGHRAHSTRRGERTVPEADTLLLSRPVWQPRGVRLEPMEIEHIDDRREVTGICASGSGSGAQRSTQALSRPL